MYITLNITFNSGALYVYVLWYIDVDAYFDPSIHPVTDTLIDMWACTVAGPTFIGVYPCIPLHVSPPSSLPLYMLPVLLYYSMLYPVFVSTLPFVLAHLHTNTLLVYSSLIASSSLLLFPILLLPLLLLGKSGSLFSLEVGIWRHFLFGREDKTSLLKGICTNTNSTPQLTTMIDTIATTVHNSNSNPTNHSQ